MSKAFISYSRHSEGVVRELAEDLTAMGCSVWFDSELTGGQTWWDAILAAIREHDLFVYALDPESLQSTACMREWDYARELGKYILPVLIAADVNHDLSPPALAKLHYVDYQKQDRESFRRLSTALREVPSPKPLPDPLPSPPDVPISYLGGLAEKVKSESTLSRHEQSALVSDLRQLLRNPKTADGGRLLLNDLRARRDLLDTIATDVDELLGTREIEPTGRSGHSPATWGVVVIALILLVGVWFVFEARRTAEDTRHLFAEVAAMTDAIAIDLAQRKTETATEIKLELPSKAETQNVSATEVPGVDEAQALLLAEDVERRQAKFEAKRLAEYRQDRVKASMVTVPAGNNLAISQHVYDKLTKAQKCIENADADCALTHLAALRQAQNLNSYEIAQMWSLYAVVYYQQENYSDAAQAYEMVLQQPNLPQGQRANSMYTSSKLYFLLDRYDESLAILSRWFVIAEDPGPEAYALEAQIYFQMGRFQEAIVPMRFAIELALQQKIESNEDWYLLLQVSYYKIEDYLHAIEILQTLADTWPKRRYFNALSDIHGRLGDEEARAEAKRQAEELPE